MTRGCKWRHAPEACTEDLGGFEKSQLVEILPWKKKLDFRLLAVALCRVRTWFGCRWKSQVYLSPYVKKALNSKVIKSFVPELRSRKCFCISGFLCYIWTFYERYMYVSHIHVWVCYNSKSPQCSRTLLIILAVLNNVEVWMVSTRPPTSKSSNPFSNPLVTVPNAPITIDIIITFMFHIFSIL